MPSSSWHRQTMRSELGKLSLDETLKERDMLNANIAKSINDASSDWGVQCLRHEIRDIMPPPSLRAAMEMQAEAERRKRAQVLESEGQRQSDINRAEGHKQRVILESQAAMTDAVNRAKGEAEALLVKAEATARSVEALASVVTTEGGPEAVRMRVAEQYLAAFGNIAKQSTTMLLPANASDPAAMVAQAMAVYQSIGGSASGTGAAASGSDAAAAAAGGSGESGSSSPKRPARLPRMSLFRTEDSA